MTQSMRYQSYRPGEHICRQGEKGREFYIVLTGTLSLCIWDYGRVSTIGAGTVFGDIVLASEGNEKFRTATAVADFTTPFTEVVVVDDVR